MATGMKGTVKSVQERSQEPVEAAACFFLPGEMGRRLFTRGMFGLAGMGARALADRNRAKNNPTSWPGSVVLAATPSSLTVFAANQSGKARDLVGSYPWQTFRSAAVEKRPISVVLNLDGPDGSLALRAMRLGMGRPNVAVAEMIASRVNAGAPVAPTGSTD